MNHHLLIVILAQLTFCARDEAKGSIHNENISNQKLSESNKQMLLTSNIESPYDIMTTETGITLEKSIPYQSQPLWSDLFKSNAMERKNIESTDQSINHDFVKQIHRNNLIQKLIAITEQPNHDGQVEKVSKAIYNNYKPESLKTLPSFKKTATYSSIPEVIIFPSDAHVDQASSINNTKSSLFQQHVESIKSQHSIDDFIKENFFTKIPSSNSHKMAEGSPKINLTVPLLINTLINQERDDAKEKNGLKSLDLNKMTSSQTGSYLKRPLSRSDDLESKWMEFDTKVNKLDPEDVTNSFSNYGDQGFDDYQSFLIQTPAFSNDNNFKNQFNNNSELGYTDQQFDNFNDKKNDKEVYDLYAPKDGSSWNDQDQDKWSNNGVADKNPNERFTSSFYTITSQDYLDDANLAEQSPDKIEDNFETTEHDEADGYEDDQTTKRRVKTYDPYDPESMFRLKLFDSTADNNDVSKNYDYDENEDQYLPEGQYKAHEGHYQNDQYQDNNLIDEFPDYQAQSIFQAGQLNHNQNLNEQTQTNEQEENEQNDQNENNPNRLDYKFMYSNNLMYVPNLSYLLRPKIKYANEQEEKKLHLQKHQTDADLSEKYESENSLKGVSGTRHMPDFNVYPQIDYSKVPGQPVKDYPIYSKVPKNAESLCKDKHPGYYANPNYQCQVYHYCNYMMTHSFLCPNGTVFNQNLEVCDWWFNVDCSGRDQNRLFTDL